MESKEVRKLCSAEIEAFSFPSSLMEFRYFIVPSESAWFFLFCTDDVESFTAFSFLCFLKQRCSGIMLCYECLQTSPLPLPTWLAFNYQSASKNLYIFFFFVCKTFSRYLNFCGQRNVYHRHCADRLSDRWACFRSIRCVWSFLLHWILQTCWQHVEYVFTLHR